MTGLGNKCTFHVLFPTEVYPRIESYFDRVFRYIARLSRLRLARIISRKSLQENYRALAERRRNRRAVDGCLCIIAFLGLFAHLDGVVAARCNNNRSKKWGYPHSRPSRRKNDCACAILHSWTVPCRLFRDNNDAERRESSRGKPI